MRWRKRINGTLVFRENVPCKLGVANRVFVTFLIFEKRGIYARPSRRGMEGKMALFFYFSDFCVRETVDFFSNKWERVGGRWVREWWFSSRKESKLRRSRENFSFLVPCREDLRSDKESNCEY